MRKLFDVEKNTFDFSSTKSNLEVDLGTSLIRAKYSKKLKEKEEAFLKDIEELEKGRKELEKGRKELKEVVLYQIN